MAEAPKLTPYRDYFGLSLATQLADDIGAVFPAFDRSDFLQRVAAEIEPLGLKDRVALIATALREHLPASYPRALKILVAIFGPENPGVSGAFTFGRRLMPVGSFIEAYGTGHFDLSMDTIAELTKRHTGEYSIRPFLAHPDAALPYLRTWVDDPNPHLRRLVSEGTRPRLPWAKKLDVFLDDPRPVLALLERLRSDPSPYVRKSVANHIKDLYRLVPEKADPIIASWPTRSDPAWAWIEARIDRYRAAALKA